VKKRIEIELDFEVDKQIMIDFKKMDEKDFVFISKPLNDKEDKAFSEFLKNRKNKNSHTKKVKQAKIPQTH